MKENYATVEHVEPRYTFRIGSNRQLNGKDYGHFSEEADGYENCVVACARCNHLRGKIDAFLFYEQKLWLPKNASRRKLHDLYAAFVEYGSMKTLRRMGNHHIECKNSKKDIFQQIKDGIPLIDCGYNEGIPVLTSSHEDILRLAGPLGYIIETKKALGHPKWIAVRLTKHTRNSLDDVRGNMEALQTVIKKCKL